MIKIGLLGLGTVGSGVYEILTHSIGDIESSVYSQFKVEKILVNNIDKKRSINIDKSMLTTNVNDILDNDDIDIVVELIGGIDSAYKYIKKALSSGKHVVTANKAVVAKHMSELHNIAKINNKAFLYEASVAGGIPIIKSLKQMMLINDIDSISGIINGTSNYILTRMENEGLEFNDVLKVAQELGYAEADPTDDVDGYDMARKLAILSSIAYKSEIKDCDILTYGIRNITQEDIDYSKKMDCSIKLMAVSSLQNNYLSATVEPVLLKTKSVTGQVSSNLNIVSLYGDVLGDLKLIGQGAGKEPTANAVVTDILDIMDGDYNKFDILLNRGVKISNENAPSCKYYIRSTHAETFSFENIKNDLSEIIDTIEIINNSLFMITNDININTKNNILEKLNDTANSVFFARIDQ